jgi:hypothetical protein
MLIGTMATDSSGQFEIEILVGGAPSPCTAVPSTAKCSPSASPARATPCGCET